MTLKKDNWGNQELSGISNEELLSEEFAKKFRNAEASARLTGYKRPDTSAYKKAANNRDPRQVEEQRKRLVALGQDKEVRKKVVEKRKQKGNYAHTEEARRKISESGKGREPPNKGKQMSEEQKAKLSKAHTGKQIDTGKSVTTPLGVFKKMKDAAVAHNMPYPRLLSWVKDSSKPEFYFTGEVKEFKPKVRKETNNGPIHTPIGIFPSKKDAYLAYEKAGTTNAKNKMSTWLVNKPTEFYYIKEIK
jgi:hypothetical protein